MFSIRARVGPLTGFRVPWRGGDGPIRPSKVRGFNPFRGPVPQKPFWLEVPGTPKNAALQTKPPPALTFHLTGWALVFVSHFLPAETDEKPTADGIWAPRPKGPAGN